MTNEPWVIVIRAFEDHHICGRVLEMTGSRSLRFDSLAEACHQAEVLNSLPRPHNCTYHVERRKGGLNDLID